MVWIIVAIVIVALVFTCWCLCVSASRYDDNFNWDDYDEQGKDRR